MTVQDGQLAWAISEWASLEKDLNGSGPRNVLSRSEVEGLANFLTEKGYALPKPASPLSLEEIIAVVKSKRAPLETLTRLAKSAEEFISANHQPADREAPPAGRTGS